MSSQNCSNGLGSSAILDPRTELCDDQCQPAALQLEYDKQQYNSTSVEFANSFVRVTRVLFLSWIKVCLNRSCGLCIDKNETFVEAVIKIFFKSSEAPVPFPPECAGTHTHTVYIYTQTYYTEMHSIAVFVTALRFIEIHRRQINMSSPHTRGCHFHTLSLFLFLN